MPRWEYKEPASRFLRGPQRAQVQVLLEAIVPGSDINPGATDADAVEYVDRLLAMDDSTYYDISRWRQQYAQGLAVLVSAAVTRFAGKALEDLAPDEAVALLKDLAAGTLLGAARQSWQSDFFSTLRSHAIEGCFADQRWGGNRDNIIWEWYGYPTGPAQPFERGQNAPINAGPQQPDDRSASILWRPKLSGNIATATKDPEQVESATLIPELAKQAVQLNSEKKPGTPWPGVDDGGTHGLRSKDSL